MKIENVILPNLDPSKRFVVDISNGRIESTFQLKTNPSSPPSLLLPALCHPHIHLDKAFLLTSHPKPSSNDDYPDYSDLGLEHGDFSEALSKTAEAKTRYTIADLVFRGSQLIAESIQAGVTSMRAFIEIDHVTRFKCLEAAIELKQRFGHLCYIQICAFAQDPIKSQQHGKENLELMEEALDRFAEHVEVLGTTPYVEESDQHGVENISWAIDKALEKGLHLDFHLDYNLSDESAPLLWEAIASLKKAKWNERAPKGKRVVFGHCTRMSLFTEAKMQELVSEIGDLPVSFVALPTSDLFMMGRPQEDSDQYGHRARGTLQVIDIIERKGLNICLGVNNVGNSFTPWGSVDPLRLACLGVGLYHAGTAEHAKYLYECVSTRARHAIGLQPQGKVSNAFDLDQADVGILAINNEQKLQCPGIDVPIPARHRTTISDVVWDPPEFRLRHLIRDRC